MLLMIPNTFVSGRILRYRIRIWDFTLLALLRIIHIRFSLHFLNIFGYYLKLMI